jgi:hypothetical protein
MKHSGLILFSCIFSICCSFSQITLSPNNSFRTDIANEPSNRYFKVCTLLVGAWQVTDVDLSDYFESLPEDERLTMLAFKDMFEETMKSSVYTFNKDSSYNMSFTLMGLEQFEEGFWSLSNDGSVLTLSTDYRETEIVIAEIHENFMVMNNIIDGQKVSIVLEKSVFSIADENSEVRKKFVGLWRASEVSFSLISENATAEERRNFESLQPILEESFESMEMVLNQDGSLRINYSILGEERLIEGSWTVTINGEVLTSINHEGQRDVWFVDEIEEKRLSLRVSSSFYNVFMIYLKVEN